MENASKALIMAGGMLIGILILSLAAYLFITFGYQASKVGDRVKEQQIEKFNSDYNVYAESDNITIYDVITVANRAKTYNTKNELTKTDYNYITVSLLGASINAKYKNLESCSDDDYQTLLEADREKITQSEVDAGKYLVKYTCKSEEFEYNEEGRIKKVVFRVT